MSVADPIEAAEFRTLLDPLCPQDLGPVAVAVSGGPDSMALAVLVRDWAAETGRAVHALTVDHGLRPEAAAEADGVAKALRRAGIPADVLHHEGDIPTRDIQSAARSIRFALIGRWMAASGWRALLLAQHREDQAETVLLRLARGSGVDGLSAIAPVTQRDGLILIRPLLEVPKARLEATVAASDLPVVRDPTNADRSHARVRMRALSETLAAEGMTPQRLADTARRMARARAALEAARDAFLRDAVRADAAGFATVDPAAFADLPEEVGLRVLSHLTRVLGGGGYPPREERVEALHRAVAAGPDGLKGGRTLAGCRVLPWRGRVLICREPRATAEPVRASDGTVWDGRYICQLSSVPSGAVTLGALGRDALAEAKAVAGEALAALPGAVRPCLPALRLDGGLVGLPHLGWFAAGGGVPEGEIAFSCGSEALGAEFRRPRPFSKAGVRPM